MNLRYLQFGAVLLWGFQTGQLYFAIPIGLMLEARHFLNRRWALTKTDFYRIADLTSVVFVMLVVFLFLNRTRYHFITALVEWLPLIFFPLVLSLAYSTTTRMPLDVLFYSLRRQKAPVTQSWDMNYVYFGMCLVSAGTNTQGIHFYMLAASALVLAALFRLRSSRYPRNLWILIACIIFISAWFTQQGLRAGHLALKAATREWLANYIHQRINPLKTQSAIGSIGRLKLSDAIAFRVAPGKGDSPPALLQEATYDLYSDNDWMVLDPQFQRMPHADDFTWRFAPASATEHHAHIYLEFNRDMDIVPVPADVTSIHDLPATNIRKSKFGSIEATGLVPSPGYDVTYRSGTDDINARPDPSDTFVPPRYSRLLAQVSATSGMPDTRPLAKVRDIFKSFRYSLYEDIPLSTDPLRHFLLESKAGHCEYFATATVLLLRSMGVPARYAIGYSVQEYDQGLGMYIVRKRHAHAWAIAWIGGQWQVVDTTPSIWKTAEAAETSPLRPLLDFLDNGSFVVQVWWSKQKLEDYKAELYIVGGILLLVLIWRLSRSEQVILDPSEDANKGPGNHQGADSPFFRIQFALEHAGLNRDPGESLSAWLVRIDQTELLPILSLHNRLRFDPRGLAADQAKQLNQQVDRWLEVGSIH